MRRAKLNGFLATAMTFGLAMGAASSVGADDVVDRLLAELKDPAQTEWSRVESDLQREWSKSGSPAMDLLLERGRDAIEQGKTGEAIEHLTALTDHAPDFAEGWNARATAYFQAGQFGPSVEDIARTLTLNPYHYGALMGLGIILEDVGEEEEARDAFRAAKAIHPHRPDITSAVERLDLLLSGKAL